MLDGKLPQVTLLYDTFLSDCPNASNFRKKKNPNHGDSVETEVLTEF